MNVVFMVNQLRKSGPIHILYNLIRNLDRRRFVPVIVKLMRDDPDRSMTHAFEELGVEIYGFSFSFWDLELRTRSVAREVDRLLADKHADMVHTHGYHPVLVASYMALPCPKIGTMHCVCKEDFINKKGPIVGRYMVWRYQRHLDRLSAAAAVSDTVRRSRLSENRNARVRLVYNGVDPELFRRVDDSQKLALREKLQLPRNRKIYVVIGALTSGKDPLTVIRAYREAFAPDDPEAPILIFLGKGELEKTCMQLIADYESIILKGYVFNTDEYLKAADYLVSASRSEGFGLSIVESLMCGVPLICSDIGPFREIISFCPELRRVQFRTGDVADLREKFGLSLAMTPDMEKISRNIRDRFSSKRMAADYMDFYTEISNGGL